MQNFDDSWDEISDKIKKYEKQYFLRFGVEYHISDRFIIEDVVLEN